MQRGNCGILRTQLQDLKYLERKKLNLKDSFSDALQCPQKEQYIHESGRIHIQDTKTVYRCFIIIGSLQ